MSSPAGRISSGEPLVAQARKKKFTEGRVPAHPVTKSSALGWERTGLGSGGCQPLDEWCRSPGCPSQKLLSIRRVISQGHVRVCTHTMLAWDRVERSCATVLSVQVSSPRHRLADKGSGPPQQMRRAWCLKFAEPPGIGPQQIMSGDWAGRYS